MRAIGPIGRNTAEAGRAADVFASTAQVFIADDRIDVLRDLIKNLVRER
jgi:hypothetical protein